MKKFFSFLLPTLLFATVAGGQALRFNLSDSPRITLLAVDCFTILATLASFIYLIVTKNFSDFVKKIWAELPWRIVLIFLLWGLVSLAINFHIYTLSQMVNAFSYWVRLAMIFYVGIFLFYGFKEKLFSGKEYLEKFLLWSGVILLFGYLQLIFLPDFSFMAALGWDPHQGRMLSTFFDPNYLGAFLVLFAAVTLGLGLGTQNKKLRNVLLGLFALSWVALYFTYSRSAWAQGAIALPLVGFKKNWKLALGIFAIFVIMVFVPTRLGSRIAQSGSILQNSTTSTAGSNFDPSAAARGESLKRGLKLAEKHWLFGVGYNAYGIALYKDGLSGDNKLTGMSSQGSDSSLLNILATTGIVGFALFVSFFVALAKILFAKFKDNEDWLAWSLVAFLSAWVAGSFFNNTLLYILILLPFLVLASVALANDKKAE